MGDTSNEAKATLGILKRLLAEDADVARALLNGLKEGWNIDNEDDLERTISGLEFIHRARKAQPRTGP